MPKQTPAATRASIIVEYVANGLSQDEISRKYDISKFVVNDTIQQAKQGTLAKFEDISDHVEECHRLNSEMKKTGYTISDLHLGAAISRKLMKLGITPKELDHCIRALRKMTMDETEASKMLEVGIKLAAMEEKYGVLFTDLPDKMEQLLKTIDNEKEQLEQLSNEYKKEETNLMRIIQGKKQTLNRIDNIERIQKRLKAHHMTITDVDEFEKFLTQSKKMGYNLMILKELTTLAEELRNRGIDTKNGLILLETLHRLQKEGIDLDTANYLGKEFSARKLSGKTAAEWFVGQCKNGLDMKNTIRDLEIKNKTLEIACKTAEGHHDRIQKDIVHLENKKNELVIRYNAIEKKMNMCLEEAQVTIDNKIKEIIALNSEIAQKKAATQKAERALDDVKDKIAKDIDIFERALAINDFLLGNVKQLPKSVIYLMKDILTALEGEEKYNLRLSIPVMSEAIREDLIRFLVKLNKDKFVLRADYDRIIIELQKNNKLLESMVPKERLEQSRIKCEQLEEQMKEKVGIIDKQKVEIAKIQKEKTEITRNANEEVHRFEKLFNQALKLADEKDSQSLRNEH